MTKKTLFDIADQLIILRKPIPLKKQVAIAVWWLATMASHWEIVQHFCVWEINSGHFFLEVCFAIEHVLLKDIICLGEYQKLCFQSTQ